MHGSKRSILLHARLDPHLDGMSPAVDQENLLAGAGDLDGPAYTAREFAGTDLMREWIGLAPKAPTDGGSNNTYMRRGQLQDLAYLAMNVMWRLSGSPQSHFAASGITGVGFPACHTGMRLERCVVVAFVVEPVFTDVVRRGKARLHIAKFVRDGFMDI